MLESIGNVAYKLELSIDAKVHPVFHVSELKKHVGSNFSRYTLPILGGYGTIGQL